MTGAFVKFSSPRIVGKDPSGIIHSFIDSEVFLNFFKINF